MSRGRTQDQLTFFAQLAYFDFFFFLGFEPAFGGSSANRASLPSTPGALASFLAYAGTLIPAAFAFLGEQSLVVSVLC